MDNAAPEAIVAELRPSMRGAGELMRPEHLGTLAPTRLSFSRVLLRRMIREQWSIAPRIFELDEVGAGTAVYTIDTGTHLLEVVIKAVAPHADEQTKSDRIVGIRWDAAGGLLEGHADEERIEQTFTALRDIYRGRTANDTHALGRFNRSYRLFDHVVERLASGRQPEVELLTDVGYLARNTGIEANGTSGTRSYRSLEPGHPLATPYAAQMLTLYTFREFVADLAEHLAAGRAPAAARLRQDVRRYLGFGNASGLGLVLFVNDHPFLFNRWLELREAALAHALRTPPEAAASRAPRLRELLARTIRFKTEDRTTYDGFAASATLARECAEIAPLVDEYIAFGTIQGSQADRPWQALADAIGPCARETRELVNSLLIELDPEFCDALTPLLSADEDLSLDPLMSCGELRDVIHREYAWAFRYDFSQPDARRYFWYKSIEAEEPRRGLRGGEVPGYDLAVDVPGDVQALEEALAATQPDGSVGALVQARPELRFAAERVQSLTGLPYHSPRMNMLSDDLRPADVIKFVKGATYGSDKCKDVERSLGRWVRGIFFHGAPTASELSAGVDDDWIFPSEPRL